MPPAKKGKLHHHEGAHVHAARLRKDLSVIYELPCVPLDVPPAEQPAAFIGSLYHYQRRSLTRMLEIEQGTEFSVELGVSSKSFTTKGGVVADTVGMGKTAQLIALLLSRPPTVASDVAALVLTPEHLCHQWRAEIARFAGDALSVELVSNEEEVARLPTRWAWQGRSTARVLSEPFRIRTRAAFAAAC